MKTVNININPSSAEKVASLYPTQKEGLSTAVENYLNIRDNTLRELQGVFTSEELIALVDMYNGTMYEPRFAGPKFLQIQIEDAEQLESAVTRHGADFKTLLSKVEKLTHAQSLVLVEECWRFWYVGDQRNIDDFLKIFIE